MGVSVARVFISYATPDRYVADEVSSWLRAAGHEPFLDGDLRDGIGVGEDWEQRLYGELRRADAVVAVVTSLLWCRTGVRLRWGLQGRWVAGSCRCELRLVWCIR